MLKPIKNYSNPWLIAVFIASSFASATGAQSVGPNDTAQSTLRWSTQSDIQTLDPHAQNDVTTNSLNGNVYEKLTAKDEKLAITTGLAQRWQQVDALTWRFMLRKGVQFHDGTVMTADDVVFSIKRAQKPGSGIAQYAIALGDVSQIDDTTVEFKLLKPNPVFLDHIDTVHIMSRAWCTTNRALTPSSPKNRLEAFAAKNANGTGPFSVVSREIDVKTVMRSHPNYWGLAAGRVTGNVKDLIFVPISSPATRVAALLTGAVDLVLDPTPQDMPRLQNTAGFKLQSGVENRVVFLGFDQLRDALVHGSLKSINPFKDLRVRQAVAHAIDVRELQTQVMRGQSLPTGCLMPSPIACNLVPELDASRWIYDLALSRALLTQAGYAQGFEVTLDCPNRLEPVCVALASMLARVDIKLRVNSMPLANYFEKLEKFDTSFYLLAWGGAETDPQPTMDPIMHSLQSTTGRGVDNYGRFANAQLDALITNAASEVDNVKRQGMLRAALKLHYDNVYHLPVHRQMLTWAMRSNVQPVHAANNHMRAWMVRVN